MRFVVAYESRGGHTERAAEAIAQALRGENDQVEVDSIRRLSPEQVQGADLIVLGTWVEGFVLFGVKPARAMLRWMSSLPRLDGAPVALFCTYAFNPRGSLGVLRAAVVAKGARSVAERAFHRRDPERGAAEFARSALEAVRG